MATTDETDSQQQQQEIPQESPDPSMDADDDKSSNQTAEPVNKIINNNNDIALNEVQIKVGQEELDEYRELDCDSSDGEESSVKDREKVREKDKERDKSDRSAKERIEKTDRDKRPDKEKDRAPQRSEREKSDKDSRRDKDGTESANREKDRKRERDSSTSRSRSSGDKSSKDRSRNEKQRVVKPGAPSSRYNNPSVSNRDTRPLPEPVHKKRPDLPVRDRLRSMERPGASHGSASSVPVGSRDLDCDSSDGRELSVKDREKVREKDKERDKSDRSAKERIEKTDRDKRPDKEKDRAPQRSEREKSDKDSRRDKDGIESASPEKKRRRERDSSTNRSRSSGDKSSKDRPRNEKQRIGMPGAPASRYNNPSVSNRDTRPLPEPVHKKRPDLPVRDRLRSMERPGASYGSTSNVPVSLRDGPSFASGQNSDSLRRQREENERLAREKIKLRIERENFEREKAQFMRLERERVVAERERLAREREEFRKRQQTTPYSMPKKLDDSARMLPQGAPAIRSSRERGMDIDSGYNHSGYAQHRYNNQQGEPIDYGAPRYNNRNRRF